MHTWWQAVPALAATEREGHTLKGVLNVKLKHRFEILDLALRFRARSLDSRKASHPLQSSVTRPKDIHKGVQGYLAHSKQPLPLGPP